MSITGILGIIYLSFIFIVMGISIAAFIFFVILTKKGIKALDIYIKNNENKNSQNDEK